MPNTASQLRESSEADSDRFLTTAGSEEYADFLRKTHEAQLDEASLQDSEDQVAPVLTVVEDRAAREEATRTYVQSKLEHSCADCELEAHVREVLDLLSSDPKYVALRAKVLQERLLNAQIALGAHTTPAWEQQELLETIDTISEELAALPSAMDEKEWEARLQAHAEVLGWEKVVEMVGDDTRDRTQVLEEIEAEVETQEIAVAQTELVQAAAEATEIEAVELEAIELDEQRIEARDVEGRELDEKQVEAREVEAQELEAVQLETEELDVIIPEMETVELDTVELDAADIETPVVDEIDLDADVLDTPQIETVELETDEINLEDEGLLLETAEPEGLEVDDAVIVESELEELDPELLGEYVSHLEPRAMAMLEERAALEDALAGSGDVEHIVDRRRPALAALEAFAGQVRRQRLEPVRMNAQDRKLVEASVPPLVPFGGNKAPSPLINPVVKGRDAADVKPFSDVKRNPLVAARLAIDAVNQRDDDRRRDIVRTATTAVPVVIGQRNMRDQRMERSDEPRMQTNAAGKEVFVAGCGTCFGEKGCCSGDTATVTHDVAAEHAADALHAKITAPDVVETAIPGLDFSMGMA